MEHESADRPGAREASAPDLDLGMSPVGVGQRSAEGGYLALIWATCRCATPLAAVREVLSALPPITPLPDSPAWLLGVFAWRNDLVALIDPLPTLSGDANAHGGPWRSFGRAGGARSAPYGTLPPAISGSLVGGVVDGVAVALGDGPTCVALAVDRLGPLLTAAGADGAGGEGSMAAGLLPRYVSGSVLAADGEYYPVLRTHELVGDVVAALGAAGAADA